MIKITASLAPKNAGGMAKRIGQIQKGLKGPKAVKVGYPKGQVGSDLLSIAIWNHFGTSRGIPPRPWVTIAMFSGRSAIRSHLRQAASAVIMKGADLKGQLARIGAVGVGMIQRSMPGTPPPNKPSTIAKKGSSTTLVDTGRLRQSTTWDYDK